MHYAFLGKTGLLVSRLSLGTMTFGTSELVPGLRNKTSQSDATAMVNAALEAGINLFDTADVYTQGESEIMLGTALGKRRKDVIVATKAASRIGSGLLERGTSRRALVLAAEASLERLQTSWIDFYQLHIHDPWTPIEETLRGLEDLVQSGKVRYVGISNFAAWRTARMLAIQEREGYAPISVAQMYYSLLGRDIETECLPLYNEAGIGLLVWGPLAGGFLSGKYTRDGQANTEGRRANWAFPPIDVDLGHKVVSRLEQMAKSQEATVSQMALAWCLANPAVASVIVGASNKDQLAQNLRAADITLTPADLGDLNQMTARVTYPDWMQPFAQDPQVLAAIGGPHARTV